MRWAHRRVRLSWPGRYVECGHVHPHPCRTLTCSRPTGHNGVHMRPIRGRIVTWRSSDERAEVQP